MDVTYTSRLKRAIRSSWIILRELGEREREMERRREERRGIRSESMKKRECEKDLDSQIERDEREEVIEIGRGERGSHRDKEGRERKS